jgi:hypothetical protein
MADNASAHFVESGNPGAMSQKDKLGNLVVAITSVAENDF